MHDKQIQLYSIEIFFYNHLFEMTSSLVGIS